MAAVLVIGDTPEFGRLLVAALARNGITARVAETGPDGLAQVAAHRPAVILLDYYMPEMTGVEFCEALAAGPGRAGTAIVVMIAANAAYREQMGQLCEAEAVLVKPVDLDELGVVVTTFLTPAADVTAERDAPPR
jgi:CheY-like chemotaxis protein